MKCPLILEYIYTNKNKLFPTIIGACLSLLTYNHVCQCLHIRTYCIVNIYYGKAKSTYLIKKTKLWTNLEFSY